MSSILWRRHLQGYPMPRDFVQTSSVLIFAVCLPWRSVEGPSFLTLSDDVIQRLAPSLVQHIGCTIIDINPGIGLWSSKLHEYLKPRNHILMEPKQNVYLPFLKPLLDAPGSRYRLTDWPDPDPWHPQRYVGEGLLHNAEGHGGPPPTTEEPNNSILIIANLAAQPHKHTPVSMASSSAYAKAMHLAYHVRHRSGFHSYGPTRMLWWLSDEQKRPLLPRTVANRGKVSVYMETSFDLEEIVGFPHTLNARILREGALDIESSMRVANRMQERNIKIPLHRQARPGDRRSDLSEISRPWHRELQKLEQDFHTGKFSQYAERPATELIGEHMSSTRSGKAKSKEKVAWTPEYSRMMTLRYSARSGNAKIDQINTVLKKQETIDQMNLDLHRGNIEALEKGDIIQALDSKIQEFKHELEKFTDKQLKSLLFIDDDRRAFAMDPPLLLWDRRKAEPLLAQEDEFYPPGKLALLDFQPRTTDEFPMTPEQSLYFDVISTCLLGKQSLATPTQLKVVAPGAFEALVPQVPAIRDPRKGGRYDIESLRTRSMTPEMIHGLAVAWDNWVFKPPMEDSLTLLFGSHRDKMILSNRWTIAKNSP